MTIDVQVEDRFAMSQRERDVRKIMQGVVEGKWTQARVIGWNPFCQSRRSGW